MRPLVAGEEADVRITMSRLNERLVPATRLHICVRLLRLSIQWKQDRSADEWEILFGDMADCLEEYSDAHIADAIKQHLKVSCWFPKVAELVAIVSGMRARDETMARRCRLLLGLEPPRRLESDMAKRQIAA